ncbi:MAG: hypothetical protein J6A75_02840 [Lachnospiraceae bacterium]|nr:hypothetical protein [Lachnospiraceae bacterium]
MKKTLGKLFLAFAVIGALMVSASIYFVDSPILFFIGLTLFIISAVGVFICAKELLQIVWELFDLF